MRGLYQNGVHNLVDVRPTRVLLSLLKEETVTLGFPQQQNVNGPAVLLLSPDRVAHRGGNLPASDACSCKDSPSLPTVRRDHTRADSIASSLY